MNAPSPINIRRARRGKVVIIRKGHPAGYLGMVVAIDGRTVIAVADDVPDRLVQDAAEHLLTRHRTDLGGGMVLGVCCRRDGCGAASTFRHMILPFPGGARC